MGFQHGVLSVCLALSLLFVFLDTSADAMTTEYLIKYIDELEAEQREMQKELNRLQGELKNITRDGAALSERKAYTDRVIELMKKLERLAKRRDELLEEARKMPHAPPLLKLVAIEIPENTGAYEKVSAGLIRRHRYEVNVGNGAGDRGFADMICSLRIVKAPLEIRPSEPFEITAEARMRKSYPDGHRCLWRGAEENVPDLSIAISSKEINAFLKGERSLESYCDSGRVQKHEWPLSTDRVWYTKEATVKGDSLNLTVRFKPIKKEISGSRQLFYYDAEAFGGRNLKLDVKTQYPFFTFDLPTDRRGYLLPTADIRDSLGTRVSYGITINVRVPFIGALVLRYEPVREKDPVISSLSIPDHPSEFLKPLKEGAVASVHIVPNVLEKNLDEAVKQLKSVGLDADTQIETPAPEKNLERTVFFQKPAPGERIAKGAMVKLNVYGQHAALIKIPRVARETVAKARESIESLGLKVLLAPGSPAASPALNNRVEGTDPPEGQLVKRGTTISVKVYSRYVDLRRVPDVVGLSAGEARKRITAAGLNTAMKAGSAPSHRERTGTVERQSPDPETAVAPGSEVSLFIFGSFVETVIVPDLQRLSFDDARRKLEAVGLSISPQDAGRPNQRNLANAFQKQDPPPGTKIPKGQTVLVWYHSQYIPTREEQVAALTCSGYPGSKAYWDNNAGKPLCGCFNGLQWNLANTKCVTQDVHANELCARDFAGSVAQGKTPDGKINCDCPQGFTWNAGKTACEKLISPDEFCARRWPGSVPAGRGADGSITCGCPEGYTWAADRTRCEKLIPPEELCTRHFPGSVPTGRDATGKVHCDCPQGYVWTADNKRCIRENVDSRGRTQNEQCSHLIFQIKNFMNMYRRDPRNNAHLKGIAEGNAQQARMLGCNQNQINQSLGTGGPAGRCPPGYYMGDDGTCAKVGSGTFGQ